MVHYAFQMLLGDMEEETMESSISNGLSYRSDHAVVVMPATSFVERILKQNQKLE